MSGTLSINTGPDDRIVNDLDDVRVFERGERALFTSRAR